MSRSRLTVVIYWDKLLLQQSKAYAPFLVGGRLGGHERAGEANSFNCFGGKDSIAVNSGDEVFASGINQKTDQIRAHVMATLRKSALHFASPGYY